MKDYSQHGESLWLFKYIQQNKIKTPNTFVDIGALDGITNSNARLFLENGWRGILFEPNPISFSKLYENTRNLNCEIFNIAISNSHKKTNFEIVTRKNFAGHSNINSKGKYVVFCAPLDSFVDSEIGILDIDAEGHDTQIIESIINHTNIRPRFIIIESNLKEERKKQNDILRSEYTHIHTINVNTIWEKTS